MSPIPKNWRICFGYCLYTGLGIFFHQIQACGFSFMDHKAYSYRPSSEISDIGLQWETYDLGLVYNTKTHTICYQKQKSFCRFCQKHQNFALPGALCLHSTVYSELQITIRNTDYMKDHAHCPKNNLGFQCKDSDYFWDT